MLDWQASDRIDKSLLMGFFELDPAAKLKQSRLFKEEPRLEPEPR
jgi:hypothetical protein